MSSSIQITSIEGNTQKLDGGSMFGNAPRAVWEKWCPADPLGRIDLACRSLLLEIDDTKILFETGIGAYFEPKLAERYGVQSPNQHLLIENLNKKNIKEEEIDYVVLSHLHFDHAGGLLPSYKERMAGNSELHFPRATYVVGKKAWERALHPHPRDKASFLPELTKALEDSKRLLILDNNIWEDKKQNIQFYLSDGHTPGQLITIIQGNNKKAIFCGDLVPGSPWMHIPITMGYDRYPEKVIDEKTALYDLLEENKDILFFTHDAKYSAATFQKDEKGKIIASEAWTSLDKVQI